MFFKPIIYRSIEATLVKLYRLLRGLSQAELTERCGKKQGYISRVENGLNITRDTRITIACVLNIEPWQLCKPEMPLSELYEQVNHLDREFRKTRHLRKAKKKWKKNTRRRRRKEEGDAKNEPMG